MKNRFWLAVLSVYVVSLAGCGSFAKLDSVAQETAIWETQVQKADAQEKEQSKLQDNQMPAESVPTALANCDTADFELTDDGKKFLEYICKTVNDFERTDEKDETFWRDFLFFAYTGLWEDEAEIVKVPRADLGFDEPVVKVRLEEAQAYARLVFGEELPDLKPAFKEMKERQTSFFFEDGYYYIGTSDFPDFQFHFADCTVYEEEGSVYAVVQYSIDFEGASNVGTVRLTLVPAENENGFVLIAKERVLVSGF